MFGLFKKKEAPPEKTEVKSEDILPEVVIETPVVVEEKLVEKESWLQKLKSGLAKSTAQITENIASVFTRKKLDAATLQELEEALIRADMGPAVAARITAALAKTRLDKDVTDEEIRNVLADEITPILKPLEAKIDFYAAKPFVLLMVGVNGVGKTTTMGKMARQLADVGSSVLMVAGDTFRAAAVAQLEVWAQRAESDLLVGAENSDPASLAYKAMEQARAKGTDVVMIDTAGRLHNKTDLMAELEKIVRVIRKQDATAPHATLLVLDATTGQNAIAQAEVFSRLVPISGLVLTKLDGSAKGGVLVALAEKFKIPVFAIGVGENIEDLQSFDAETFTKALCGVG
jgi:fused signal recognition particle receptor